MKLSAQTGGQLYQAYGLTIASDIVFPELPSGHGSPHLWINTSRVDDRLDSPDYSQHLIQKNRFETLLLFKNRVGASFLIKDGRQILVDLEGQPKMSRIRLALLGYGITALLFQRRNLVLHGNTLHTPAGAITICGQQGAGKSTLTVALLKRGFAVMADDVASIETENRIPMIKSGFPRLKLWQDTLDFFQETSVGLDRVLPQNNKYSYPLNGSFHATEERLSTIYILKLVSIDQPTIRHLSGVEKLMEICGQVRSFLPEQIPLGKQWLLQVCGDLAEKVNVVVIERPALGNSIEALAELIQQDLQIAGKKQA